MSRQKSKEDEDVNIDVEVEEQNGDQEEVVMAYTDISKLLVCNILFDAIISL